MSLAGKESCTGEVRIGHGDENYWLSGSSSTWNWDSANAVCRQLHCGQASNYSSIQKNSNNAWMKSYNCTSTATSLFSCDNLMPAADHGERSAHVTCTGENTRVLYLYCLQTGADPSLLDTSEFLLTNSRKHQGGPDRGLLGSRQCLR